jgi:uncharacterized protein YaeQ
MWWQQNQSALRKLDKLTVIDLAPEQTRALAALAQRSMTLQCTLQENEIWLIADGESLHIAPQTRMAPETD